MDSKLDFNWSEMLVNKIRRLMVNYGYGDPFKSKIQKEILITDIASGDLVSPGSKKLLEDLGQMIGVKLLNSKSSIKIKNFMYEIGSVTTDLKTSKRNNSGLIIDGDFAASGIKVVSDEIKLTLELPTANGGRMPLLEVGIKKPFLLTKDQKQISVAASVQILEGKDDVSFKVLNSDFNKFADLLSEDPESIQLGFEDLVIPEVSLRIGTKQINIKPEKVKDFIAKREDQLKALLIDQLRAKLREGAFQPMLKVIEEQKIAREYWVNTETVYSQFAIGKISSSVFAKNLEVNLPADFCTTSKFQSFNKNCLNLKETKTPKSVITNESHERSLVEIKDALTTGDANLVASISEDYLNKLLAATYDAGLYNDMLDEAGASLGAKRAFIRLDEKGQSGTLYADVIYKITGIQGTLVGKKEIRFPLVIKCSMRFENKLGNTPVMLIRLDDADLSDQVLRNGLPELGLVSTVKDVPRFKGKIIKTIRESTLKFIGKDVISMDYPEFKGLGLETVQFSSDGNGRMGAQVRLEELLRSDLEINN
ncbi:MAG: hypothetical protein K2P81_10950 [Bacteriovoracaceae bacterium]|nr:hypothetical protein [Bacteriovoracaceae bacterium]